LIEIEPDEDEPPAGGEESAEGEEEGRGKREDGGWRMVVFYFVLVYFALEGPEGD
jgi:hypothetical protein